jgi:hypothetical protein
MKEFKKYYLMRVAVTTLFGALLGGLFLLAEPYAVEIFDILLIAMGLMTAVMNLPAFLFSLFHVRRRGEWISLVVSLVAIVFGVLLTLVRRDVILLLLGVFSVVFPVLRICLVAERKKRLVREIPLIAFGLLMVLISVLQVEELVFFVCAMIAFGITALYLLWSLLTLKPRLAAYAAWEAEQQAAGHDVSLSDK